MNLDVMNFRALVQPEVESFANVVRARLPGAAAIVEEAASQAFPLSYFVTMTWPGSDEGIVLEVALHKRDSTTTVSAEVLREEGDVLAPVLIRELPSQATALAKQRALTQFAQQLGPFLEAVLSSVVTDLTSQLDDVDQVDTLTEAAHYHAGFDFVERAQRFFTTEFKELLSPRRLEVSPGHLVPFDLVSSDQRIVGKVKRTQSARFPQTSITAAIWQLQRVPEAQVRFLVVGPNPTPIERWLQVFGATSAADVRLWVLDNHVAHEVTKGRT